ncbi:thiamine pyrophosphate-binding protein [Streptomyces sp. NPDC059629]|uniref:thiamine pyrophosphate-binding protein n=1 Tax=Streptomyces sp. NPDC059629 TaxID=3346889 RepID=UPI0036C947AE
MGYRPALALLEILRSEGVDRLFGNPGTTELPFLAALSEAADAPEYVPGVHEGAVVSMADGYARGTGRPAFVGLHIAAGLANGLVGCPTRGAFASRWWSRRASRTAATSSRTPCSPATRPASPARRRKRCTTSSMPATCRWPPTLTAYRRGPHW